MGGTFGSTCRSPLTKRFWAERSRCRPSTERSRSPCRRAPIAGVRCGCAARDCRTAQGTGDLLVTPKIVLPERADPDLEEMMQRWQDEKPYDPRAPKT